MQIRLNPLLSLSLVIGLTTVNALAMELTPGHFYTSNYFSSTIRHYSPTGSFTNSLDVPPAYGDSLKGLSFGPDRLLYAVTVSGSGFKVI